MEKISFEFIDEYSVENDNLGDLSTIQQKQLATCIVLYYGEEGSEMFDKNDMSSLFDEDLEGFSFASFYHIMNKETNEVMFDFWNYNADSGAIFVHNTTNSIGIEFIQFSFDFVGENEFNKNLPENFAEILQKEFDKED